MVSRCSRGVCPLQGIYPPDVLRECLIPRRLASTHIAPEGAQPEVAPRAPEGAPSCRSQRLAWTPKGLVPSSLCPKAQEEETGRRVPLVVEYSTDVQTVKALVCQQTAVYQRQSADGLGTQSLPKESHG
jgi:hypothetical protein